MCSRLLLKKMAQSRSEPLISCDGFGFLRGSLASRQREYRNQKALLGAERVFFNVFCPLGTRRANFSYSNVERVTAFWNISDRVFKLFGFEMKRSATTLGHDYIAATGAFPAKITEITDLSPTEFDLRRPKVEMMDNLGTIDR
jgi:hypothetical protein